MGDSLAAGYGATPATQGYAYLLYQSGTFDQTINTIFANAAVPGATSQQVLAWQVPSATQIFRPHVVTISVGGNDLLAILNGADPAATLLQFQSNLSQILGCAPRCRKRGSTSTICTISRKSRERFPERLRSSSNSTASSQA
jgi:lysophospholipase L1-like esterase